jgi:hypothetical protein
MTCFRRANIAPGSGGGQGTPPPGINGPAINAGPKIITPKSYLAKDIIMRPSIVGSQPDQISVLPSNWTYADPAYCLLGAAAATDGTAIDTWNSYQGSHTYSQASASLRPLYKSNQWGNGLPSVLADGVDDYMSGGASVLALTNNISSLVTIILGGFVTYSAGDGYIVSHSIGTGTSARAALAGGSSGSRKEAERGLDTDTVTTITSGGTFSANQLEVLVYIIDYTNKQGRILRNGVQILAFTTFTNQTAGNTSATNSNQSQLFAVAGTLVSNFAMSHIVQYKNTIPPDNELVAVSQYLGALGGLYF